MPTDLHSNVKETGWQVANLWWQSTIIIIVSCRATLEIFAVAFWMSLKWVGRASNFRMTTRSPEATVCEFIFTIKSRSLRAITSRRIGKLSQTNWRVGGLKDCQSIDGLSSGRVFKDNFSRHSDLHSHENQFLGCYVTSYVNLRMTWADTGAREKSLKTRLKSLRQFTNQTFLALSDVKLIFGQHVCQISQFTLDLCN